MAVVSKGTLFDPNLVSDLISKVKGKSSLARLSAMVPVSFNGNKEFIFNMDSEIDIVAENGQKKDGGATITPVTIVPIKFVYGMRVSDEFVYAAEEDQIPILEAFNDGFAKKIATGLDQAAFHGINPSTGTASAVIGDNHFDKLVTQTVTYAAASVDANLEAAIAAVEGSDGEVTGMAISPAVRSALAALTNSAGDKRYPEFAFGGQPTQLGSNSLDINKTVSVGNVDQAIVGDFANMFKWGYAKEIPTEIIEFGDPDGNGDLKRQNQVYIRAEVYLGWGILDAGSFARVVTA
jgi:hypothetical protein